MKKFIRELANFRRDIRGETGPGEISNILPGKTANRAYFVVKAPTECCYEGGQFIIRVEVNKDYPFTHPEIRFRTHVWHPNVSSVTGFICLDIIDKNWTPALSISQVIVAIMSLLDDPNPDSPQDSTVSAMMVNDRPKFDATAKEWTEEFASEEVMGKIKDMEKEGFAIADVIEAMFESKGNEENAKKLLGKK